MRSRPLLVRSVRFYTYINGSGCAICANSFFCFTTATFFNFLALQVTVPQPSTVCHGGQPCTVEWLDDGTSPLLTAIGICTVGLYSRNQVSYSFISARWRLNEGEPFVAIGSTNQTRGRCDSAFINIHSKTQFFEYSLCDIYRLVFSPTQRRAPIQNSTCFPPPSFFMSSLLHK